MRLSSLTLTDYRSYTDAQLTLHEGPNVLLGFNGVGKTNVVEAVGYLSTLGSHRVTQDTPLVRHGRQQAIIRAQAHRGRQEATLEVEINPRRSNRARINRGSPVRATEVLGILRTVLFAPEDLELVKGPPEVRRRLLDDLAVQLRPALGRIRQDYEKVLRQRNALLKSIRYEGFTATHESTLAVWDQQLADAGSRLLHARLEMLTALRPHVETAYQQLSGSVRSAGMTYLSSLDGKPEEGDSQDPDADEGDAEAGDVDASAGDAPGALETMTRDQLAAHLHAGLQQARPEEHDRGVTLLGPHRDDVHFGLDDMPVKGFASHGETWSYALALRLAAYRVMLDDDPTEGAQPILILDDVFAELDARRRQRLAELASRAEQLLVTAAVDDDVPEMLLANAVRIESVNRVSRIIEEHSTQPAPSDEPIQSDQQGRPMPPEVP